MEDEYENVMMFNFNLLTYLGSWKITTDYPVLKYFYKIYAMLVHCMLAFITYMGILDFQATVTNPDKVFFNVCTNLLIIGTWMKVVQTNKHKDRIDSLRMKLHRSMWAYEDEEEFRILRTAGKEIKTISGIFYCLVMSLHPMWLVSGMITGWFGEKDLPIPGKWPDADLNDGWTYFLLAIFQGAFALFYLLTALPLDITLFGLLVGIRREYSFLIKSIQRFGEVCNNFYNDYGEVVKQAESGETNYCLKRAKTRKMLRDIINRQKHLLGCMEEFEFCYHAPMFVHIFIGGILLVVTGFQVINASSSFSVKKVYIIGYVFAIIYDMLILCTLTNSVSDQCLNVGTAFYSTSWYKFDVDIQKDILLVILRSQKPPRVTSGNFLVLNLHTLMEMMKNIYSWLALLRQLFNKK